ncbi:MAG: SDR family oxidoreductase [Candidatus Promineifilaceae bacterium]
MARLLITGGSSYLGQFLVPMAMEQHQTSYTYYTHNPLTTPSAYPLDLRDSTAVNNLVNQLQPEIIIHTAGSNRPADMVNVIVNGTRHIAKAAEAVGARLIHISTDVVFNGQDAPYAEDAPPTPIHAYGRAKAEAETFAAKHPDCAIIRTSLIYSLRMMDHGTAWLVNALHHKKPVTLFSDQRRNPVWADTLSLSCLELATNDYRGVLHVAGEQVLSRAEFGLRMLDWWDIEERSSLTISTSDHTKWPADCTFDLSRAKSVLNTPLPGVDEVLSRHSAAK